MATIETLRVGDRIADKYVVERLLGKGGMGLVVAARHVDLDQSVAIKFILPDALRQHGVVERLLREARASAKLRSEHVARVTDVGRTPDGAPYLVMELLEGRDLSQIVDEGGPLHPGQAALYVAQACEAIAEAHEAGIIHRDIKPANLFVTVRRDGSPCVKVLDFGIAKEDSLANAAMTSTGSVLGTPMYMSPEQVRSSKTATPATDIWALGITLYELTTAGIPYDVTTVTELIAKILTEAPIPPRRRNAAVPPELEAVIMRCLQVDPAHRYQSARELQQALMPLTGLRTAPAPGLSAFTTSSGTAVFPAAPVSALTPPAPQRSLPGIDPVLPVPAPARDARLLSPGTESGTSLHIPQAKGASRAPIVVLLTLGALGVLGGGAVFVLSRQSSGAAETPRAPAPDAAPVASSPPPEPAPVPASAQAALAIESAPPASSLPPAPPASSAPAPSAKSPAVAAPPAAPKKPPPAPKPPDKPPAPATAKPGWGGLL